MPLMFCNVMCLENNMTNTMWRNRLTFLPVIFAGILGVIGIFEDVSILLGQDKWEESTIYIKYYAAILGIVGFAFVPYMVKKRNDDIDT